MNIPVKYCKQLLIFSNDKFKVPDNITNNYNPVLITIDKSAPLDKQIRQIVQSSFHILLLKESDELTIFFGFSGDHMKRLILALASCGMRLDNEIQDNKIQDDEIQDNKIQDDEIQDNEIRIIKCDNIQQVVCGAFHAVIFSKSNELFTIGYNEYGELGLGNCEHKEEPILLMTNIKIRQIAISVYCTFILQETGELLVFGDNRCGELGLGDYMNRNKPTLLMSKKISQIACGNWHTIILTESGELLTFGRNSYGQLGLGDNKNRNKPTLIMIDKEIHQIACGGYHTIVLKKSPLRGQGELFAFGCNEHGQLGLGDRRNRNKPTLVMRDKGIRQIICKHHQTFVYKNSGELIGFGRNLGNKFILNDCVNTNRPMLIMKNENLTMINEQKIKRIKWSLCVYSTLSCNKKKEILFFILVCNYYKKYHKINMVKYMKHMIIELLF